MNSSIYISDKTWEEVLKEWPEATATKAFKKLWEERKDIPQEVPQSIPHNDMIPEGTEKREGFTLLESLIVSHIDRSFNDLQPMYAEDVKEMIEEVMSQHLNDEHTI